MKRLIFLIIVLFVTGCDTENELSLKFAPGLNPHDFKITVQNMGLRRKPYTVFDGLKQYAIQTDYGENDWFFSYKDSLYAYHRHFITNRNDRFKYTCYFYKEGDMIFARLKADGEGHFDRTVTFTSTQHKYR